MAHHNNPQDWKVNRTPTPPESTVKTAAKGSPHGFFNKSAANYGLASLPELGEHSNLMDPNQWIGKVLLQEAIKGGLPLLTDSIYGTVSVVPSLLVSKLIERLALKPVHVKEDGMLLASDDTMMSASYGKRSVNLSIATSDPVKLKTFRSVNRFLVPPPPENPRKGYVYALGKRKDEYNLIRIGAAGQPLERGNYTPEVMADYDHVISDLKTNTPCGRLIIMSGAPGTGKTFLVKSLLSEVPEIVFVLVPPHMVSELGSPELLPVLVDARSYGMDAPIVLVIEDADKVLVERKSGDMNAIAALLNLGDGIMGSALDLRILCTTNAEELEMDPATRRPGRLCRYIKVEPLDPTQASNVLERLTAEQHAYDAKTPLSDIYRRARDLGWNPAPVKEVVPPPPPLIREFNL